MNRRKTIKRPSRLLRAFSRRPRNRRIRAARSSRADSAKGRGVVENTSEVAPRRPDRKRIEIKAVARGILSVVLVAVKVTAALGLLAGAGFGGYHAYQRVMASTYFDINRVDVQGTRQAAAQDLQRLVQTVRGENIFTVDLDSVSRSIQGHPWVKAVRVRRELPGTLRVTVTEHKARSLLLMGHLYLVSSDGVVFKQADPDEQEGLPVITGISRLTYLNEPARTQARVRKALHALDRYYGKVRPALSEVHVNKEGRITLYVRRGGVAVRMGDEVSPDRLSKLDAVWAALGPDARRARVLFLDNETRTDRVTVRMGSY